MMTSPLSSFHAIPYHSLEEFTRPGNIIDFQPSEAVSFSDSYLILDRKERVDGSYSLTLLSSKSGKIASDYIFDITSFRQISAFWKLLYKHHNHV